MVPWVARLKTIGAESEQFLSGSLAVNVLRRVLLAFCEYILSVFVVKFRVLFVQIESSDREFEIYVICS